MYDDHCSCSSEWNITEFRMEDSKFRKVSADQSLLLLRELDRVYLQASVCDIDWIQFARINTKFTNWAIVNQLHSENENIIESLNPLHCILRWNHQSWTMRFLRIHNWWRISDAHILKQYKSSFEPELSGSNQIKLGILTPRTQNFNIPTILPLVPYKRKETVIYKWIISEN